MSDIEFFAKFNPKPFKSLAMEQKERIEAIKEARSMAAGKPQPAPEPVEGREPFYD